MAKSGLVATSVSIRSRVRDATRCKPLSGSAAHFNPPARYNTTKSFQSARVREMLRVPLAHRDPNGRFNPPARAKRGTSAAGLPGKCSFQSARSYVRSPDLLDVPWVSIHAREATFRSLSTARQTTVSIHAAAWSSHRFQSARTRQIRPSGSPPGTDDAVSIHAREMLASKPGFAVLVFQPARTCEARLWRA